MAISIVLAGNEVIGNIFRTNLGKHFESRSFDLFVQEQQDVHSSSGQSERYTTAMRARTAQKAQDACTQVPTATIGVSFENGVIQTAHVLNLMDLNILEMTTDDIRSGKIQRQIQESAKKAREQTIPTFKTVSVVSVADTRGLILQSDTLEIDGKTSVSFTWGEKCTTAFEPEAVDKTGRIPHQLLFLRCLQQTLIEYHEILATVPTRKN